MKLTKIVTSGRSSRHLAVSRTAADMEGNALYTQRVSDVESPVYSHRLFDSFIRTQEQFASGRPVASNRTRAYLVSMAATLAVATRTAWNNRDRDAFNAGATLNRMVEVEGILSSFSADSPQREDFSTRRAPWAPDESRLDGETEELEASMMEAMHESHRLRLEIQRLYQSATNRCSLAKLGKLGYVDFGDLWWGTSNGGTKENPKLPGVKAQMREIGADERAASGWVRACERELNRREYEAMNGIEVDAYSVYDTFTGDGASECDADYNLPALGPNLDWAEWQTICKRAEQWPTLTKADKRRIARQRRLERTPEYKAHCDRIVRVIPSGV